MKDNANSIAIKPLATSHQGGSGPHIASWKKPPGVRYISNLRVNRALPRKSAIETLTQPIPTAIRGERFFEPSQDLQERIKRLQETETMLATTTIAPPPPTQPEEIEKRKIELKEAQASYEEQIEKLKRKERELQETVSQAVEKIAEQEVKADTQQAYSEELSNQQTRIHELEAGYQDLQEKLAQTQDTLKTKVTQLQQLKTKTETGTAQEIKNLGQQVHDHQEKINLLKNKRDEMVQHIHKEEDKLRKLQDTVSVLSSENKEKELLIEQQRRQLEDLQRDKEKISRFANELVKKLSQVENLQRVESTITVSKEKIAKSDYKPKIIKAVPQAKDIPLLTDKPNAISGIVRNTENDPLEGALIVIKNKEQQPQRALRTNKVGEFLVSALLPNGIYRIETQKEGMNFDIIELELSGNVLKPIEIIAVST